MMRSVRVPGFSAVRRTAGLSASSSFFGPAIPSASHITKNDFSKFVPQCHYSFGPMFSSQIQTRKYSTGEVVVKVPTMGDSITEGQIGNWAFKVGDNVKQDDVIGSIETDKINIDVRAPHSGKIIAFYAQSGDTVKVGADLYKLSGSSGVDSPAASAPLPKAAPTATPSSKSSNAPPPPPPSFSPPPAVKSAPAATSQPAAAVAAPKPSTVAPGSSVPQITGERSETRIKMKKIRIRIAERLKNSQNTFAMLTTFQEVDMGNLIELRESHKDAFLKKHGVKLGFVSAFAKAATMALQEQPVLNAVIDGEEIIYRSYVDISIAVASPNGLVVPVVRSCEKLSFADIERQLNVLATKARNNTISLEEMSGGSFTISNGGVFGSMMGTPIINPPQSAILGIHAVKDRPVAIDGKVVIRPMMYLALTYDHRLIDGREAATFLVRIRELIEEPARLLLGV